ncbi:hypothetical protein EUX98_g3340 [Antrodiella citrinella]|uniref:BSD domain-containing protein n=1 Tax=Antrodiella citrinella TaxID=2447956 RepID=A0A4S4MZJ4_9APHY|nr:hypothetical protein EUX98_g3340 [Antrodiella citrinella]
MPSTTSCSARASYKKLQGTLELTGQHLQWTQDGQKAPSVKVPKEGAAAVRLKLGLVSDETGHNFTFTSSPPPLALSEREKFKVELTNIIARNRGAAPTHTTPRIPGTPAIYPPIGTNVASPRPPLPGSRASMSRAPSVSSDSRGTPSGEAANDFRIRKRVLMGTPELAALHRELVIGGHITEAEFWDGREHLLHAQKAAESQKKGKSGQLVDPRPQTVDGEVKIVITPQLVHDIFEEYPVVSQAYNDNVPNKLNEAEFWKRYFQSKLFNAHRASIRSSATQHVVKDDTIFDKYLQKDDDELEPRSIRDDRVDVFIDLGATREDHGEKLDVRETTREASDQLRGWGGRLSQFRLEKKAGEAALVSMTQNVSARLDVKNRENDIPEGLLRQMTTCQTAANEFLRQFWLAIYPPPSELQTASASGPAQKAAKAAKMIGYLEKTGEKVDGLVRTARAEGVDPEKVQVAMKPVTDAVEKAMSFWRIRSTRDVISSQEAQLVTPLIPGM